MSELIHTAKDASGRVEVGIFREQERTAGSYCAVSVEVADDMLAVGGGAIGSKDPGAFLTASRPDERLRSWFVASKDHTVVDEHRLDGFAIGLKIDGMTRAQLRDHIVVVKETHGQAHHPEARAKLESDKLLISGGFEVIPNDGANLATASHPEFQRVWRASSKDHFTPDQAEIDTYAIGISELLDQRDAQGNVVARNGRIVVGVASNESGISNQPFSEVDLPTEYAMTGVGAVLRWTEHGLLLWELYPRVRQREGVTAARASGKDHLRSSKGSVQVWAIGIKLNSNPCD